MTLYVPKIAISNDLKTLRCRLLVKLVEMCEALPIMIPTHLPTLKEDTNCSLESLFQKHMKKVFELLSLCDGIILPGNKHDVPPSAYNVNNIHPQTLKRLPKDIYDVRFETESLMFKYALDHTWPILGICGGMQVANISLGGSLVQHLPQDNRVRSLGLNHVDSFLRKIGRLGQNRWEKHFEQHILRGEPSNIYKPTHSMRVDENSLLGKIYASSTPAVDLHNIGELSIHHQGCFEENKAPDLKATAWAPDGVIEALEFPKYPNFFLLTQFHFECNVSGIAKPLIEKFMKDLLQNAGLAQKQQELS